jgi:hypothetical protein
MRIAKPGAPQGQSGEGSDGPLMGSLVAGVGDTVTPARNILPNREGAPRLGRSQRLCPLMGSLDAAIGDSCDYRAQHLTEWKEPSARMVVRRGKGEIAPN